MWLALNCLTFSESPSCSLPPLCSVPVTWQDLDALSHSPLPMGHASSQGASSPLDLTYRPYTRENAEHRIQTDHSPVVKTTLCSIGVLQAPP